MDMEIDASKDVPLIKDEHLFKAAETGDSSAFTALSSQQLSQSLSLRNEDNRSLLHVAVSSGHADVVKILATADQSAKLINCADEEGWAPIHSAASIGRSDILDILLSGAPVLGPQSFEDLSLTGRCGADVNLKNNGGRTALHYASSKGWLKIAETLIAHGAKINQKDKVGCTPLHRAASTGNSELCELLIEEGAEVDATDKAGQTPLMNAVICQNKEVALLLIRHGADVDVEDREGFTVLGRASNDFRPALIDAAKTMLEG